MMILMLVAAAALQTQADLNQQAGAGWARADAAMNVQYRLTMAQAKQADGYKAPDATTGPSYEDALLASQRAWLAFRDAECLVEGYRYRGGSAQHMEELGCKQTVTEARTRQLKTMLRTP